MSKDIYDIDEMMTTRIAWYYYFENMTQKEISDLLGISRMKVIKFINLAKDSGLVQFQMRQDDSRKMHLEKQIKDKYHLDDVFLVPDNPEKNKNETVAKAAAMYLKQKIKENTFINIGYGDTLSRTLNHLARITDQTINFVSLTGGVSYYLPNATSREFNARLYLTPTPLLVSSQEVVKAITSQRDIQNIFKMIDMSSFSLVGIGSMVESATVIESDIISKEDMLLLKMKGAVGDVLCHFIDKNGEPINDGIENHLISTPLSKMKTMGNVIGIAAGIEKKEAIKATLKGGYINTLITTEDTALAIMNNN